MKIVLKKVAVHNLKNVDLELPAGKLILFTGVSGSGKSSMAFDTIFVEGQRRYIESLSPHAREILGEMSKPAVESVSGLSPTIAIEQKSAGKNPRSTVGTMTEIYDFVRVLYARVATPHCPITGEALTPQSKERIIKLALGSALGHELHILAPYAKEKKGEFKEDFAYLLRRGFMRARIDGTISDLSEEISLDKKVAHNIDVVIDRIHYSEGQQGRLTEAILQALEMGNGQFYLFDKQLDEERLFSTHAYSQKANLSYPALEPSDFSFNSPSGSCSSCHGLGETQNFALEKIIDPKLSIAEDCCKIASSAKTVRYGNIYRNLSQIFDFSLDTPWEQLPEDAKQIFLYGSGKKWLQMHFVHPDKPVEWTEYVRWQGVIPEAKERYAEAKSDLYRKKMEELMDKELCPECLGSGCKPYPSAARFQGFTIHELMSKTIGELLQFFNSLSLSDEDFLIAEELLKEIKARLFFLNDVGLSYLTLSRRAPTLSGGEAQRVRLAAAVGSGLVGITYILDEPSIGLHPRDNSKLIASLTQLRDKGNTVIVVEHDEETIRAADLIVDFGPGAGSEGGEILVNGSYEQLIKSPHSLTGKYVSGKLSIEIPAQRRAATDFLRLDGATLHNLKNCSLTLPLSVFVAITGVSGSGKSSLILQTLYPALAKQPGGGPFKTLQGAEKIDKIIAIDQSPIGKNPRSTPATYIKLFDEIRRLFAELPESRSRGYAIGRFSFNVEEGACPSCKGMGSITIDMDFLEDQSISCPHCQGRRYDPETLSITYKGKNIDDVLRMTVAEALAFFSSIPLLKRKLELLEQVGMGYMTLGQPSNTLSGGEAQRIKLAKELSRSATSDTLYILDEPTTGLHFHDIKALLSVLNKLVDRGASLVVIEHNMEVVKTADYVIDLGPDAGSFGGEVVAEGTPEQIAALATPTAKALKETLYPSLKKTTSTTKAIAHYDNIEVLDACQNNLKHVSLTIPRGQMTICCGPSGSGKSSFAFETVYAEGQRRYVESLGSYARQFVKQMPKPKVGQIEGLCPTIAIEQKLTSGNPRSTIGTQTEIYDYLRILFATIGQAYCPESGEPIEEITPQIVVDKILHYPEGEKITLLAPIELSRQESDPWERYRKLGFLRIRLDDTYYELENPIPLDRKRKNALFLVVDRIKVAKENRSRLYEAVELCACYGDKKVVVAKESGDELFNLAFAVQKTGKSYKKITPKSFSFNHPEGMCPSCQGLGVQYGANLLQNEELLDLSTKGLLYLIWSYDTIAPFEAFLKRKGIKMKLPLRDLSSEQLNLLMNGSDELIDMGDFKAKWLGVQPILARAGRSARAEIRAPLIPLLDEMPCISCKGCRLNPLAQHVRIKEHTIASLCSLPLIEVQTFLKSIAIDSFLEEVKEQLLRRLQFLLDVGLDYLSLDRKAPTLSNGESQRIRLAGQLGSQLTGILYVLDEPTIGLHPHDHEKLFQALDKLKKLGNTLLVVEHDPLTLQKADLLVDFGPAAGSLGGNITAMGSYQELLDNPNSLTGAYLSGRKSLPVAKERKKAKQFFPIENASIHNLKNLSFDLPLGRLVALTGVSGSGKSTLLHEVIKKRAPAYFDRVIAVDQDPIGQTSRADVGSYSDLLPPLRSFFASLAAAKTKGLAPRHFSTNHVSGMCTSCYGLGYKKVEMLFLPPVYTPCDGCCGLRLNPQSLSVTYQGFNFGQVLGLTISEAKELFSVLPKSAKIFDTLLSVGLGYLKLGQQISTLSGGEAQRIKLCRELAKRAPKNTLYLLDEPTTGLHPDDIVLLLNLLQSLVDRGSSCVLIEHNTDVIARADYIIDLGPYGGRGGGEIVAMGTAAQIAQNKKSLTGKYLAKLL